MAYNLLEKFINIISGNPEPGKSYNGAVITIPMVEITPTLSANGTTVFTRGDNVVVIGNAINITETIGGTNYYQKIDRNAASEVLKVWPWSTTPY